MLRSPSSPGDAILVPVANREAATRQLDTAVDIATDTGRRILVVHVVTVPPQIPIDQGHRLVEDDDRELLEYAAGLVADRDVPVDRSLRIARSVAGGIRTAIEDHDVGTVLAGWRGRPPRSGIVLGSHLDRLLREADCDVLVKRIRSPQPPVESVLVPVAAGPHTEFAVATAASIARVHDAPLRLLYVLSPDDGGLSRAEAEELLDDHRRTLEGVPSVDREIAESANVAGAITDRTATHDLTVLGVSEGSLLQRKLLGTVSQSVGGHAEGSVLLAKRYDPARSRFRRLLR